MPTGASVSNNIFPSSHPSEGSVVNTRTLPATAAGLFPTNGILKGTFGTYGNPSFTAQSLCGKKSTSYYDLFYERIWIIPETLSFTGIPATTNVPVVVWNSYSSSKTLTTISSSVSGINHDLTLSKVFAAFESVSVNFQYTTAAPLVLDGVITFTFSNAEDPMLMVTGSQAELFLYNHNWETEITERYEYLTNIIESDNATEQGIMLRSYPRRKLEYNILSAEKNNQVEMARQRAFLENFLSYAQDLVIALPILTDKLLISATVNSGSNSLTFNKNPQLYDFYVNGFLVIYDSYNNYELVKISSITSTTIGLSSNTTKTWNAGAKVVPIRSAMITEETVSGSELTRFLEGYNISFEVRAEDTINNPRFTTYSPTYTYKGYPVFFHDHNYDGDRNVEIYKHSGRIGTEYGIFKNESRMNTNRKKTNVSLLKNSRTELCEFLGFFSALKGRLNYCWLAEKNKSFQLAANYTAGQNFIRIYDIGYYRYIKQNLARRDLVFYRSNGSIYFNRITDSVSNGDGTETLYLENTFAFSFTPTDFLDISYLTLCRSESDALEISYDTQESASINHSFLQMLNIS